MKFLPTSIDYIVKGCIINYIQMHFSHCNLVVSQFYITEAENEYVIKGNSAVMKCKIPSFVADYVSVEAWVNVDDGSELTYESSGDYG